MNIEEEVVLNINPLAADQRDYAARLVARAQMNQRDVSASELITKALNDLRETYRSYVSGLISKANLTEIGSRTINDLLDALLDINPDVAHVLNRKLKGLSMNQIINLLGLYVSNPVTTIMGELDRASARTIKLNTYKDEINSYIEQSKKLIDSLPPKLRSIVNTMKDQQTAKYKELKEIQRNKKITNNLAEINRNNITNWANLGFGNLVNRSTGAEIPIEDHKYYIMTGFPRAFFCRLPSILSGIPHDICVFSGIVDQTGTTVNCKTRYMQIKQLGKRVYNFKYKAWWGPMVRFFSDANQVDPTRRICIVLRTDNTSDVIKNAILNSAPITMYELADANAYKNYMAKLVEVRTLNFKVKRTAQRFMRNNMAKFLNTDKQIVQEIGQYTNISVK